MKKITLHDIMESLVNDDLKNAQTSLHEWFVERSRQIHSKIGKVAEGIGPGDTDDFWDIASQYTLSNIKTPEGFDVAEGEDDELWAMAWKVIGSEETIDHNSLRRELSKVLLDKGYGDASDAEASHFAIMVGDEIDYDATGPGQERVFVVGYLYGDVFGDDVEESAENITENEDDEIFDALDGVAGLIVNGEQEGVTEVDLGDNLADLYWKSVVYKSDSSLGDGSVDSEIEELKAKAGGNVFDYGYYPSDEHQVGIVYVVTTSGMDESVFTEDGGTEEWFVNLNVSTTDERTGYSLRDQLRNNSSIGREDELGISNTSLVMGWYVGSEDEANQLASIIRGLNIKNSKIDVSHAPLGESGISESEDDYNDLVAELKEAFAGLEAVSDKLQNVEGAQVGEEGKVPVNKKSTLPSHKGDKRVGGAPVAIKSKGHTGHALEKSPKVADVKTKGNVQNSKDDPKKVAAPKGALLNKMDGSVNTQSPISGKGAKGLKK